MAGSLVLAALLAVSFTLYNSTEARHLPKFITKCHRSDPQLNDCVKRQVEKLRPRLLKGIPELLIPPYDPLVIPMLSMEQGTNAVKFKANFTNVQSFGAKKCRLDLVNVDLKTPSLSIHLFFPTMRVKTNYNINGNILLLPMKGNGSSDGNFTSVTANVTLFGNYTTKNNLKYINLMDRKVSLHIGGAHMYFDNFLNGDKQIIETTNRFLNENWQDIVKELNPIIEETAASLVFQFVKHVFDNFPLDEILPP